MPLITPETALTFCKHPFTPELARELNDRTKYPRKPRNKAIARLRTEDPYLARKLKRTRKQIDVLSDRLDEELVKVDCDGQRIDRLASALARLCEIERQLAGRPLPGSLRPVRETKHARATITLTPEPQAVVATQSHNLVQSSQPIDVASPGNG